MDGTSLRLGEALDREKHLKNVLLAIRRINRLITTEVDEYRIIQQASELLVGIDSYFASLIVLVDAQGQITASANGGTDPAYAELSKRIQNGYVPECVRRALAENGIVMLRTDPECGDCPLASASCENHIGMSGPLQWDGHVLGVMTVSVDAAMSHDEEERALFSELLSDIGFALHKIAVGKKFSQNQQALRASEERFHMLARYSPQVIYLCRNDRRHSMLFLNEAIESISGFPKEVFLSGGKPFTDVYHPDDLPVILQAIDQGVAENKPFEIAYRVVRKDGSICWVEEYGGIIRTEENDILLVGTILDVTARKQDEVEKERLVTAIEQLAETVVITDSRGVIQYVNAGFEQSSGYSREEAIGEKPSILKSGKQDRLFYQDLWTTIKRGETWTGYLYNRRKDGSEYEEEAIISPIRDAMGQISNFVAVKRDVTLEHSLQRQLLQSQKMEAVGMLAGGIAHDFNNLLTVIMSAASFVRTALPISSHAYEDAEEIIKAAARAAELTRQLLAFSRRQIMVPKEIDLNEIVSGMEKMLRRLVPENISLVFKTHPDPLPVCVDAGQIEQVVLNLVVNARDAIQGQGEIVVETFPRKPSEADRLAYVETPEQWEVPMAVINVSDNGSGIPAELKRRIFDPFFSTKEEGQGSGLGLSTALGIVRQHHGTVSLYSEADRGTVMHVYLPLIDGHNLQESAASREVMAGGSETLLVVEDNAGVRKMIMRMLSGLGYQILTAGSGTDALNVVRNYEGPIHALMTDMIMPGMNGVEVAERVKELRPEIKVLFASGYPEAHLTQSGINLGSRTLIRKPFSRSDLSLAIRELLDQRT